MSINIFLADYVDGSSNKLQYILDKEDFTPFDLPSNLSEWSALMPEDIILLKTIPQSNKMSVDGIGYVFEKTGDSAKVKWHPIDKVKVKTSTDDVFIRKFTKLFGKPEELVQGNLILEEQIQKVHNEYIGQYSDPPFVEDEWTDLEHSDKTENDQGYKISDVEGLLNISKSTIIDFLIDQGFSVDDDPNAILSQDQFDTLSSEFGSNQSFGEFNPSKESSLGNKADLKHALSTIIDDPVLTKKGYHKQGKIGYILKEQIGDSVPLHQVLLDKNGIADYFSYIQNDKEDLKSFKISEKKLLGYVSLSGSGGKKFNRYVRKKDPKKLDHFYCTNPTLNKIAENDYELENKNGFESSFILKEEIEGSTALYVYSNSPGIKLFSTAIITSPSEPDGIKILIQSNIAHDKSFWWLHAKVEKWEIDKLKIGQSEPYGIRGASGKIQKHFQDTQIGDLVIGYQGAPDKRIKGIFEVSERDLTNKIDFKLLYKLESQTKLDDIRKIPEFTKSAINKARVGSLHPLSNSLFQEIINTTELKVINPEEFVIIKSSESKIANITRDADKGTDYLDIRKDVTAFAKVIASSNFSPPLAIALFGQWGTGKSFFMNKLKDNIEGLSNSNKKEYRSGIAQIHFNAWSYLDANLWASLVSRIFEGLNNYIKGIKTSDDVKKKIEEGLSDKLNMIREERVLLEEQKKINKARIGTLKGQKTKLRASLNKKISEVNKSSLASIVKSLNKDFKIEEKVSNQLSERFDEGELKKIKLLIPEEYWSNPELVIREIKSVKVFVQSFFRSKNIGWFIFFVTLSIGLYMVIPRLLESSNAWINTLDFKGVKIAISSITLLVPTWARYKKTYDKLKPIVNSFIKVKDEYDKELANAMFEHEQHMLAINHELNQISEDLELAGRQIAEKEDEQKEIDFKLNHALSTQTLYSYIDERANSSDYKKHLGIVSTIRKDFEILSDLFTDKEKEEEHKDFRDLFEPRLERIVLYIDDLDRCKDEQVIQVLEAVNLLMAFPLFVVVVGVDPRWVKNALLKQYHTQFNGVKNGEEIGLEPINPSDYLEKIFQVPFHLEQASDGAVKNMLSELSSVSVVEGKKDETQSVEPDNIDHKDEKPDANDQPEKKDSGNEDEATPKEESKVDEHLSLKPREVKLIPDMSKILGTNPRSIKRFVNVYHILRAHENLMINHAIDDDYLVLMFLLALPIGEYRELNTEFVKYISLNETQEYNLDTFLQNEGSTEAEVVKQREKLESNMTKLDSHKKLRKLPISMFKEQNKFIQRFTFSELA